MRAKTKQRAASPSQSGALAPNRFDETHPPLSADKALTEAAKCLYCYDAPCMRACPTHIDIPGFIRQILHHDTAGAARTILDANIFGGSCARVCPTEVLCEGACVDNTLLKTPVLIGRLQRFACDSAHDASMDFYEPGPDTGKRVAIVGAGPAGLTCAHELRKRGHAVVVFEAGSVAGGLNTLGIAAYKITTQFALSEVDRVLRLGIDLRLKHAIDGGKLATLLTEYDATLLAVGLGKTAALGIPGENLSGVWESLDFIFQTHQKPRQKCKIGRQVVIIGGGNTAIDAARASLRLGAERVTIAYRRDAAAMPAFQHEHDAAIAEGVDVVWNAIPLRFVGRGRVSGVRFARARASANGSPDHRSTSGARRVKPVRLPGGEFTLAADMAIKALGQEPLHGLLGELPELQLDPRGRVRVERLSGATSVKKLFAAGDCIVDAGEEVVNAVQTGKIAAAGIHELLSRRSGDPVHLATRSDRPQVAR